ncbi:MAG: DUF4199 domain-containing protein [Pseudomonadota bacterium]
MTRYALIYGGLAGLIVIVTIVAGTAMADADTNLAGAEWMGYLVMLVALSLVFVGIKRYRDQQREGYIGFWGAAGMGASIAIVAGVIYVFVWEIYLYTSDYQFMEQYAASVIAESEADGMTGTELEELKLEMDKMSERYASPLFRLPMTFLEIFPVGLLISLISAAFLRRIRPPRLYED